MNILAKKVRIPNDALIKPYFDTQQVKQNQAEINFFPAVATRKVFRDNYVSNPFPGNETRRVVGLSFEIVKQFLREDAANGIDVEAIINGIKDAGVTLTADNNHVEFLRTTIARHSNFAGSGIAGASASADVGGAVQTATRKTLVMKSARMHRILDPFDLAPTQNLDLKVQFHDASVFPAEAEWEASGQSKLYLRAVLYLAELESAN